MMFEYAISILLATSFVSIGIALFFWFNVKSINVSKLLRDKTSLQRLLEVSDAIQQGANSFLKREYTYMLVFIAVSAVALWGLVDLQLHGYPFTAFAFIAGAAISMLAGYIGMIAAVTGNSRTSAAATRSLGFAFRVAFNSGAVMGFGLTGLALVGLLGTYLVLEATMGLDSMVHIMEALAGFGLGGSSIALFARVGGGIYTKAADVGADLAGKVEEDIPEDDPRNPAVVADNVGDNVGDVAGMGADLFGSIAESACAALVIGSISMELVSSPWALMYPVLITCLGIPTSLIGTLFARANTVNKVEVALKRSLIFSTLLMGLALYILTPLIIPESFEFYGQTYTNYGVLYSVLTGLLAGVIIGYVTDIYTSYRHKPVKDVAKASVTGSATNIISGLALGYISCVIPIIILALAIFTAYSLAGMYGIGVASLGMLGTIPIGLTIDAFGPVADNAGGIAEMSGLGPDVRAKTDALDAAGNTTAAIGKSFAIGSAALTSLALFSAFMVRSGINEINMLEPHILSFLLIGALMPFIFLALTMKSVGNAALKMVEEVRRQFQTIPGLRPSYTLTNADLEKLMPSLSADSIRQLKKSVLNAIFPSGKIFVAAFREAVRDSKLSDQAIRDAGSILPTDAKPNYHRCVDISTKSSLNEMLLPGAQVIFTPLLVGYLFGASSLAALLIGSLVCGVILATASANSGGAWDNAKKYIELGNLGGRGSEAHKAAVIGDTVGDPLKDTSGPSLNILIKLQAIISLVFAPFFL